MPKLNPSVLRHGYEFLCSTEPFNRWNLPDSDEIVFRATKTRSTDAQLWTGRGKPVIDVSAERNGHTVTVLSSLAHEMIHLHEARCKIRSRGVNHHGAAFRKWAAQVCKAHGFDLKLFY